MDINKNWTADELQEFSLQLLRILRKEQLSNINFKLTDKDLLNIAAIGLKLSFHDTELICQSFKNAAVTKMRSYIRNGGSWENFWGAPYWIRGLEPSFGIIESALKAERASEGGCELLEGLYAQLADAASLAAAAAAAADTAPGFTLAADVARESDAAERVLRSTLAIRSLTPTTGQPVKRLYMVWNRLYRDSKERILELWEAGDRVADVPAARRCSATHWRIAELALLYDTLLPLVTQETLTNAAKMRSLVFLYNLLIKAHDEIEERDRRKANRALSNRINIATQPGSIIIDSTSSGSCDVSRTRDSTTEHNIYSETVLHDNGSPPERLIRELEKIKNDREMYGEQPEPPEMDRDREKEMWARILAAYTTSGRCTSGLSLQRRWLELRRLARYCLLRYWAGAEGLPHVLLMHLVTRFPAVVLCALPSWSALVRRGRVYDLPQDIQIEKQVITEEEAESEIACLKGILKSAPTMLSINEKDKVLPTADCVKTIDCDDDDEDISHFDILHHSTQIEIQNSYSDRVQEFKDQREFGAQTENLDCRKRKSSCENLYESTEKNVAKKAKSDTCAYSESVGTADNAVVETDAADSVIHSLENIDPTRAQVSIELESFSDDEVCEAPTILDSAGTCAPDKTMACPPHSIQCDTTRLDHDYERTANKCYVKRNKTQNKSDENENAANTILYDLLIGNVTPVVNDEKLTQSTRVIVTPLELIPMWRKYARDDVINCRRFSMRSFTSSPVLRRGVALRNYAPAAALRNYAPAAALRSYAPAAATPRGRRRWNTHMCSGLSASFLKIKRNLRLLELLKPVRVLLERLPALLQNGAASCEKVIGSGGEVSGRVIIADSGGNYKSLTDPHDLYKSVDDTPPITVEDDVDRQTGRPGDMHTTDAIAPEVPPAGGVAAKHVLDVQTSEAFIRTVTCGEESDTTTARLPTNGASVNNLASAVPDISTMEKQTLLKERPENVAYVSTCMKKVKSKYKNRSTKNKQEKSLTTPKPRRKKEGRKACEKKPSPPPEPQLVLSPYDEWERQKNIMAPYFHFKVKKPKIKAKRNICKTKKVTEIVKSMKLKKKATDTVITVSDDEDERHLVIREDSDTQNTGRQILENLLNKPQTLNYDSIFVNQVPKNGSSVASGDTQSADTTEEVLFQNAPQPYISEWSSEMPMPVIASVTSLAPSASGATMDSSSATSDSSSASGATVDSSSASDATVDSSSASGATVDSSSASGAIVDSSSVSGATVDSSSASGDTVDSSSASGATVDPSSATDSRTSAPESHTSDTQTSSYNVVVLKTMADAACSSGSRDASYYLLSTDGYSQPSVSHAAVYKLAGQENNKSLGISLSLHRSISFEDYMQYSGALIEPIFRLDSSRPLWTILGDYILVTPDYIPIASPTYWKAAGEKPFPSCTQICFPKEISSEYPETLVCECTSITKKCDLCTCIRVFGTRREVSDSQQHCTSSDNPYKSKGSDSCTSARGTQHNTSVVGKIKVKDFAKLSNTSNVLNASNMLDVLNVTNEYSRPLMIHSDGKTFQRTCEAPLTYENVDNFRLQPELVSCKIVNNVLYKRLYGDNYVKVLSAVSDAVSARRLARAGRPLRCSAFRTNLPAPPQLLHELQRIMSGRTPSPPHTQTS